MNIEERLEYFKSIRECQDGTVVKWFIYNSRKEGLSNEQIVRELSIRNNMAIASSGYSILNK